MMILSEAILFPQGIMPLHIFEPRYRQMLVKVLATDRMFVVARQRPETPAEVPEYIAGLGLVRVCVDHPDGTSHLMIQGLSRVRVELPIRRIPYPCAGIQPVVSVGYNSAAEDDLVAKVRELVAELIHRTGSTAMGFHGNQALANTPMMSSAHQLSGYLETLDDAGEFADFVSGAFLNDSGLRQILLETENIEQRLRRLIQFLLAQVRQARESQDYE